MARIYYKFLFLALIGCLTFIVSNIRISNAKPTITPLANETDLLTLMHYNEQMKFCDQYLDHYAIIKNIEYYDFEGNLMKDGEIVVNDALAENVINIFEELKSKKFPIAGLKFDAGIKLVDRLPFGLFGWKKLVSNEAVNSLTGAFYCRNIAHTDRLSLHSFGTAIDINTLQNPCIFIDEEKNEVLNIVPKKGIMFLNRKTDRPGKPYVIGKVNDQIVTIFHKNGFDIWGGNWDFPIDYQHFQASGRKFADLLMMASKENARKIFAIHTKCFNQNKISLSDLADNMQIDLIKEYSQDSSADKRKFFKLLNKISNSHKTIFFGKAAYDRQKDKNDDFITIKIEVTNNATPGSYVSRTTIDGKTYNSVSYVDNEKIISHLLNFNSKTNDKQIKIKLIKYLHKNSNTNSKTELLKTMKKDAIIADQYFQWER